MAKNDDQTREDLNRQNKLLAVSILQDLLRMATSPTFTGSISVEVHVKDGQLCSPVDQVRRFHL